MAKKADKITYEKRVNQVLSLIYRGWDSGRIVQNIAQAWDIQSRQAYGYLRSARNRIAKLYKKKREVMVAEMLARHDDLRDKGYVDRDYHLVLQVDKEDAKLLGMYAPDRHHVEVVDKKTLQDMTNAQIDALAAGVPLAQVLQMVQGDDQGGDSDTDASASGTTEEATPAGDDVA